MQYPNSVWDDPELLKTLRKMAALGIYSAAELATELNKKFGTSLTRMSVMGKCYRTGISLIPRPPTKVAKREPRSRVPLPPHLPPMPTRDLKAPQPLGDVGGGCRWIHGLAETRNFCGAETAFGASWCEYHKAKVFTIEAPSKAKKFMKYYGRKSA